MKRRDFLAASCCAGVAPLTSMALAEDAEKVAEKEFYELRTYRLEAGDKAKAFADFLAEAAVPALNRIGIGPVGVFGMAEGDDPTLYVLLPHKNLESVVTSTARLLDDKEYLKAGAAVLDAPKDDPAFVRIESSLSLAFDECPEVEVPTKSESRVLQLRIYESHNAKKAKAKVDMFNAGGEIALFRKTGMPPVFFGETLVGDKFPNLTYMLSFENAAAQEAGWKAFLESPEWAALKKIEKYKGTVSNITNLVLRPLPASQI